MCSSCREQNSILVLGSISMQAASVCSWTLASSIREKLVNTITPYVRSKRFPFSFSLSLLYRSIFFFAIINNALDRKREYWGGNQLTCIYIISSLIRAFFIFHLTPLLSYSNRANDSFFLIFLHVRLGKAWSRKYIVYI